MTSNSNYMHFSNQELHKSFFNKSLISIKERENEYDQNL
jgi:hypothetical protein